AGPEQPRIAVDEGHRGEPAFAFEPAATLRSATGLRIAKADSHPVVELVGASLDLGPAVPDSLEIVAAVPPTPRSLHTLCGRAGTSWLRDLMLSLVNTLRR